MTHGVVPELDLGFLDHLVTYKIFHIHEPPQVQRPLPTTRLSFSTVPEFLSDPKYTYGGRTVGREGVPTLHLDEGREDECEDSETGPLE